MALSVANRAYVIETGRVILSGTAEELHASEEIKKAYLGWTLIEERGMLSGYKADSTFYEI